MGPAAALDRAYGPSRDGACTSGLDTGFGHSRRPVIEVGRSVASGQARCGLVQVSSTVALTCAVRRPYCESKPDLFTRRAKQALQ